MSSPGFAFALSCTGCAAPTFIFTLHATKCSSSVYPGVSVVVSGGGGSGTTDGSGNAAFSLAAGTYTVTCTDPQGIVQTFTLVMGSANQTVNRNFITTLSAGVTDSCGGAGLSGASVTFTQGGVALGTVGSSAGVATLTLTTAVSTSSVVTVSVTYKGTTTSCTFTPNAACTNTCGVQFKDTITVTVTGCNGLPLPGASVSISPGSGTATTNGSGVATITPSVGVLPGTSVTATATKTRFTSNSVTFSTCSASVALSPTSSYVCIPGCADPLATTLNGTDPLGSFTLTYDATQGEWVGCVRRNAPFVQTPHYPGCTTSGVPDTPILFSFTGSAFGIKCTNCGGGRGIETDEACSTNTAAPWPASDGVPGAISHNTVSPETITCPPSFSDSVTYQFTNVSGSLTLLHVYGSGNSTFTITE